jgi:hypothetical protein
MNRKYVRISKVVVKAELLPSRSIPMAVRSKAWVCGSSLAGTEGSKPARGIDVCLLSVVCCQAEISAEGRSLVQRSPTDCGVSECVRGTCRATRRKNYSRKRLETTEISARTGQTPARSVTTTHHIIHYK